MSGIKQPVTQIKLTNVAVVRYRAGGKRFEIACYKNKVMNYRNKIEKDLDEVLQSLFIFTNVSKGVTANKSDLINAFGTDDVRTVAIEILDKGEVQVSEKERQLDQESKLKEIATIISQKCINKETNRPFPTSMIERCIKEELHYSIKMNQTTKQQSLEVIKLLKTQNILPQLERAQMRVQIIMPAAIAKAVLKKLKDVCTTMENEEWGTNLEATVLIDPGNYRPLEELVNGQAKGKSSLNILDLKVQDVGERKLEEEQADKEAAAQGFNKHDEEPAIEEVTQKAKKMNLENPDEEVGDEDEEKAPRKPPTQRKKEKKKPQKKKDSDEDSDDGKQHLSKSERRDMELLAAVAKDLKSKKKGANKKNASKFDSDDEEEEKKTKAPLPPVSKNGSDDDASDGMVKMANKKKQKKKKVMASAFTKSEDEDEASEQEKNAPPPKKASEVKNNKKKAAISSSSESESESESESSDSSKKPKNKNTKKPTATKGKKAAVSSSSESSSESDSDSSDSNKKKKAKQVKKKKPVSSSSESESESSEDTKKKSKAKTAAAKKTTAAKKKKAETSDSDSD